MRLQSLTGDDLIIPGGSHVSGSLGLDVLVGGDGNDIIQMATSSLPVVQVKMVLC
jgi:Ca2+-binding RTX toxin-like protein